MNIPAGEDQESQRIVDGYFEKLQRQKADQETRRDQVATLITGGALTVSFAFVSGLRGDGPLIQVGLLTGAWVLWALALVGSLVGYTMSIWANHRMLIGLSSGNYDLDAITPPYAKYIEKANIGVLACLVLGFISFGTFALGNLQHGYQEEGEEKGVTQEGQSGAYMGSGGIVRPGASEELAASESKAGGGEMTIETQETERGLTLPIKPPRFPEPQQQAPERPPAQSPPKPAEPDRS